MLDFSKSRVEAIITEHGKIDELMIITELFDKISKLKHEDKSLSCFRCLDIVYNYHMKKKKQNTDKLNRVVEDSKGIINALNAFLKAYNENNGNVNANKCLISLTKICFSICEITLFPNYQIQIYPVFLDMERFLISNERAICYLSPTGSGKTRSLPLVLAIRSQREQLKIPFIVMTEPKKSLISQKIKDFNKIYGDNMIITCSKDDLISLYKLDKYEQPILGLLTPFQALILYQELTDQNIDFISKTRFIIDEMHERSIHLDIFISRIIQRTKNNNSIGSQLVLMSATPDSTLLKSMGIGFFESEFKSTLFPIEDEPLNITKFDEAYQSISLRCAKIVDSKKWDPGHILIFLPGIASCREVLNGIVEELSKKSNIHILPGELQPQETFDGFLSRIKQKIDQKKCTIYVVPIIVTGCVDEEQKKLAINDIFISKSYKIIKIICATNIVESSITIPNLACVIDSGMYKQAMYDSIKGITSIKESLICEMMRKQRRGRLGRTRKGIFVPVVLNGTQLPTSVEPYTNSIDIASAILSLKQIKINLEDEANLPNKLDERLLREMTIHLQKSLLLSKNNHITSLGRIVAHFNGFSPFLTLSTIQFKHKYGDDPLYGLFAGHILLIFLRESHFVRDNMSKKFQEYYDNDSDIITLFRITLDLLVIKKKHLPEKTSQYGVSLIEFSNMKASFWEFLFFIFSDMENSKINFDVTLREYTNWIKTINLLQLINEFIQILIEVNPEWIKIRRAEFNTILNSNDDPIIVYHIHEQASRNPIDVMIRKRPGSFSFNFYQSILVFSLEKNTERNMYYGWITHPSPVLRPVQCVESIPIESIGINDFFIALLQGFIEWNSNNELFYGINQDNRFSIHSLQTVAFCYETMKENYLTFCPKNKEASYKMRQAIDFAYQIMPYTSRSLIIKSKQPECIVEILSNGSNQYDSKVYTHFSGFPDCYKITQELLRYLTAHKALLAHNLNHIRLATACSNLLVENNDYLKGNSRISFNIVPGDYDNVFVQNISHLICIVDKDFKIDYRGPKCEWNIEGYTSYQDTDEKIIQRANNVSPNISASHKFDLIIYYNDESLRIENNKIREQFSEAENHCIKDEKIHGVFRLPIFTNSRPIFSKEKRDFKCNSIQKQLNIDGAYVKIVGRFFFIKVPLNPRTTEPNFEISLQTIITNNGTAVNCFERFPITSICAFNNNHQEEEFVRMARDLSIQFGDSLLSPKIHYKALENSQYKGRIFVDVIGSNLGLAYANSFRDIMECPIKCINISPKIVNPSYLRFPKLFAIFKDWIKSKVPSLTFNNQNICGDKKAGFLLQEALKDFNSEIFGYDVVSLSQHPWSVIFTTYKAILREHGDSSVFLDRTNQNVVIRKNLTKLFEERINRNIPKSDVFGCVENCNDSKRSRQFLSIFNKDPPHQALPICTKCYSNSLDYALENFKKDSGLDFDKISVNEIKPPSPYLYVSTFESNEYWPQIPLCQLLWILLKERKTSKKIREWITIAANQAICTNKSIFTYCPKHPNYKIPIPNNEQVTIRCPVRFCHYFYCFHCEMWENKPCTIVNIEKIKRCPKCLVPTSKSDGCNHISCPCGHHWCYKCGLGFNTQGECYNHMKDTHGNFF